VETSASFEARSAPPSYSTALENDGGLNLESYAERDAGPECA